MSYDESDAQWDRFIDEIQKDFRESALEDPEIYDRVVDDFREARLREYYLEHPLVAEAADGALAEAANLVGSHPRPALILAVVAAEVCLRDALLTPILHGSFHTESSAELLVSIVVRSKDEKLVKALLKILANHAAVDLQTFKRTGSLEPLWEELHDLQQKRNRAIHQAEDVTPDEAASALEVAQTVVRKVFAQAVTKLGLHLHDQTKVCGRPTCSPA
jgi:hypothetical protein